MFLKYFVSFEYDRITRIRMTDKFIFGCLKQMNLHYSLWGNGIGSEGTKAVAKALEGCPNLTHL